jgi:hypothetical protein
MIKLIYKIKRACNMNNSVSLEEKINNLLKDFVLDKNYRNFHITPERELRYMHKSGMVYITVKIFSEKNVEDKITNLLVHKRVTKNSNFTLNEHSKFKLQEKNETALNKLKMIKTKIYLTQIF